jgi:hypothetical protein
MRGEVISNEMNIVRADLCVRPFLCGQVLEIDQFWGQQVFLQNKFWGQHDFFLKKFAG